MEYIKSFDEFVNESLISKQIPFILKLKPGDVIYAKEDYNHGDIDYSRMSKNFVGKITQLNARNMYKGGFSGGTIDWSIAKKDDVIGIVLSDGEIAFQGGWSCNIKDSNKSDYILDGLNILYTDDKIDIRKYNKKSDEERSMVFNSNLYYGSLYQRGTKEVTIKDMDIEFDASTSANFGYDRSSDELIVKNGFSISTGEGGKILKIKNASSNDDIKRGNKSLNDY